MPIKATSNDKGMWITWETPDEGISTTFRIRKTDKDEEVLGKLFRLTRFIASQMDQMQTEIAELETQILGADAAASGFPPSVPTASKADAQSAPPDAPRILMTPQTSDLPAGGPPVQTFGWADMPTRHVPPELASTWEMIPPGEE